MRAELKLLRRGLRRDLVFSATVIASLALCIGVGASVFSVADRLLLRPPEGVGAASELNRLYVHVFAPMAGSEYVRGVFSYPEYMSGVARGGSGVHLAAYTAPDATTLRRRQDVVPAKACLVTDNYFTLLQAHPAFGRFFQTQEESSSASSGVAVVSYALATRLAVTPAAALGQVIHVYGLPLVIIGVAAQHFTGTEPQPIDVWIPLRSAGAAEFGAQWMTNEHLYPLTILVRRVAATSAPATAQRLLAGFREVPVTGSSAPAYMAVELGPLLAGRGPMKSGHAVLTTWLAAIALIVLVIACINVGTMYLARGMRRADAFAVQLALGASRARLVRQVLLESAALTAFGGTVGLLWAVWGASVLRRLVLPAATWGGPLIDLRVVAVTVIALTVVVVATALAPALLTTHVDLGGWLKASTVGTSPTRSRWRTGLHIGQASLSVFLLVGAGLFLHSYARVQAVHLGFDPQRLVVAMPEQPAGTPARPRETSAILTRAADWLRHSGGVDGAAVAVTVPLVSSSVAAVEAEGVDAQAIASLDGPYINGVTPRFFRIMRTRIVRGRSFAAADGPQAPRVGIINEGAARRLWPSTGALGRCVQLIAYASGSCIRIVGVAEDTHRMDLVEGAALQLYLPLAQIPAAFSSRMLVVRLGAHGVPAERVRSMLHQLLPSGFQFSIRLPADELARQTHTWRVGAALFSATAVLAMLLVAVGLYGSLSYSITQRQYEIGVRMALGATPARIWWEITRFGIGVALAGVVGGACLLITSAPRIAPLLFGTTVFDPVSMSLAGLATGLVAVLAAANPARTASRGDPTRLLRTR